MTKFLLICFVICTHRKYSPILVCKVRPAITSIPSIFWDWDYEHCILGVEAATQFVASMIFFLLYHSTPILVNNREGAMEPVDVSIY